MHKNRKKRIFKSTTNSGKSLFQAAVYGGHTHILEYLVSKIKDYHKYFPREEDGGNKDTPLFVAIEKKHLGTTCFILSLFPNWEFSSMEHAILKWDLAFLARLIMAIPRLMSVVGTNPGFKRVSALFVKNLKQMELETIGLSLGYLQDDFDALEPESCLPILVLSIVGQPTELLDYRSKPESRL